MPEATTDWGRAPLAELVDHIIVTHHGLLHRAMPLLSAELTQHVRDWWMKHPELLQAHTVFHRAKAGLEQHLIQEETAGFPLIKRHERDAGVSVAPFVNTVAQHREAHAQVLKELREVQHLLWDGKPPADVGPGVAVTLQQLAAVVDDLATHIHLENDVLFKRLEAAA